MEPSPVSSTARCSHSSLLSSSSGRRKPSASSLHSLSSAFRSPVTKRSPRLSATESEIQASTANALEVLLLQLERQLDLHMASRTIMEDMDPRWIRITRYVLIVKSSGSAFTAKHVSRPSSIYPFRHLRVGDQATFMKPQNSGWIRTPSPKHALA